MKTNIVINFQFEALHHWETCPEDHSQAYLKYPHRHIFYIQLKIPVLHDDRDIEFIELKQRIIDDLSFRVETITQTIKTSATEQFVISNKDFGAMSCEMIAKDLLQRWNAVYVRVLEDNENGAEVYKEY